MIDTFFLEQFLTQRGKKAENVLPILYLNTYNYYYKYIQSMSYLKEVRGIGRKW